MLYIEALAKNPWSVSVPPGFLNKVETSIKYMFSYQSIMWATIFFVKLSFLSFFPPLINHLAKLKNWWIFVTVCTTLAWGFCVVDVLIICPHLDQRSYMSLIPESFASSYLLNYIDVLSATRRYHD